MIEEQPIKTIIPKHSLLQIYCLGTFRIIRPGENASIGIISKHKMWLLFKYLVTHRGTVISTERVINFLWPKNVDMSDTASLRTTISRLKSLLEPKHGIYRKSSYVLYSKDSCTFNMNAPYWLDIEEFGDLCKLAHRYGENNRQIAIEKYLQALELYQGDFLSEDSNLEWTIIPREHYRRLYMESIIEVTTWLIENRDFLKAETLLKKAIQIDPYVEPVQILLMKVFLGMGKLKTAAEHYSNCSSMLYKELGVKPSGEWKQLYKQIRETEGNAPHQLILVSDLELSVKDPGPFVCEPEFFWGFLLCERRRLTRNGGEATLVVLELSGSKKKEAPICIADAEVNIESIVFQKLRQSDLVCKLDQKLVAILLPATGTEGSQVVINQIREAFEKHPYIKTLSLQINVKRVTPLL